LKRRSKFLLDGSISNFLAPDSNLTAGGTKFPREQPIHHRLDDSPGPSPRV